ncbi:MAG: hypothetical protein ACI8WM_001501, partial [Burkholderiaceae bacterium]
MSSARRGIRVGTDPLCPRYSGNGSLREVQCPTVIDRIVQPNDAVKTYGHRLIQNKCELFKIVESDLY